MTTAASAVEIKGPSEIELMREAGVIVAETLKVLSDAAKAGVSTAQLDRIAENEIRRRKAKPAFLHYRGFPATLCASVNDEVVHGIPREDKILAEGDLVSLDLGCVLMGYFADAAVTVPVGRASPKALDLLKTTRECLERAIAVMEPGRRIGDISAAVQEHAEAQGYSVVRVFVGHGIGRALHESPAVPNFGRAGTGMRLVEGMVLAVEPMINQGGPDVRVLDDGWTAVTSDGAISAHFEHTIAVTSDGPRVLTAPQGL